MTFTPTAEQETVIEAITKTRDSLLIRSPAGGSKTTMLKLSLAKMLPQPLLAIAFNKRNADDFVKSFPQWVTCKTYNALGHAAWGRAIGKKLTLDSKKAGQLVSAFIKEHGLGDDREMWQMLLALLNGARNVCLVADDRGRGLVEDTPDAWDAIAFSADLGDPPGEVFDMARSLLRQSVTQAYEGLIDFSDQIYMSVCYGGVFTRFPTVMVDEAQDASPSNHEMLSRSMNSPGGRLIAVGDPFQAIYAFRGADANSMFTLRDRFALREIITKISFRCPKAVTELARERNPNMEAFHTNAPGRITTLREWTIADVPHECAILCRNNAPLMKIAFRLIRAGRGANFLGGDLSKGLNKLLSEMGPPETDAKTACEKIALWRNTQTTLAVANGKPEKLARIEDKAECMIASFEAGAATIAEATRWITRIFSSESGRITLSTGHKCKGFEWDNVIFLDPWRIPSRHAKTVALGGNPAPLEQELNLRYVIRTRARDHLITASTEDFS